MHSLKIPTDSSQVTCFSGSFSRILSLYEWSIAAADTGVDCRWWAAAVLPDRATSNVHGQFQVVLHRCWPAIAFQNCCLWGQYFRDTPEMPGENWRDIHCRDLPLQHTPKHTHQANNCPQAVYTH